MLDFIEIMRRFEKGERLKEQEFDLQRIAGTARKISKAYGWLGCQKYFHMTPCGA